MPSEGKELAVRSYQSGFEDATSFEGNCGLQCEDSRQHLKVHDEADADGAEC